MVKLMLDGKAALDIVSHAQLTAPQIAINKQLTPIIELFRVHANISAQEELQQKREAEEILLRQQRDAQFNNQLAKLEFMKFKKQQEAELERYACFRVRFDANLPEQNSWKSKFEWPLSPRKVSVTCSSF
jgi:4-alpha-glucanotransferase